MQKKSTKKSGLQVQNLTKQSQILSTVLQSPSKPNKKVKSLMLQTPDTAAPSPAIARQEPLEGLPSEAARPQSCFWPSKPGAKRQPHWTNGPRRAHPPTAQTQARPSDGAPVSDPLPRAQRVPEPQTPKCPTCVRAYTHSSPGQSLHGAGLPYSLVACGHTFCADCLQHIARTRLDCPLCRCLHRLPLTANAGGIFLNDVVLTDVLRETSRRAGLCVCWDCATVFLWQEGSEQTSEGTGECDGAQQHTRHRWSTFKDKDPHQIKLACWLLKILRIGSFDLRGTQLILKAYSEWIAECQSDLDKLTKIFAEDKICAEGYRADVFQVLGHNRTASHPVAQTSGVVESLSRMWSIGVRDISHHLGFLRKSSVKYSQLVSDHMLVRLQEDKMRVFPEGLCETDLDTLEQKGEQFIVAPQPVRKIALTQILGPSFRHEDMRGPTVLDMLGKRLPNDC